MIAGVIGEEAKGGSKGQRGSGLMVATAAVGSLPKEMGRLGGGKRQRKVCGPAVVHLSPLLVFLV